MVVHEGHTGWVRSVAYSPDGKSVVSGSSDKTVRIWNAHGSSSIGEPLRGHSDFVYSVSYSPLGNLIASASHDKTIRLWDTTTGQQSGDVLKGDHPFLPLAFSPDGKLIASGSAGSPTSSIGCAVQLWDVQTRKAVSEPFKGHANIVLSVSFSPDGAWLVSGSYDETIRIWDAERGTTIVGSLKGHTGFILSCSEDGTIRFWDARSGGMIGKPYTGHAGVVWSAAFSPSGTYVASGGDDKTVRVWDIRTSRQVDQSFEEHTGAVHSVAYSPCGQYIASGSSDCKVIIRRVLSGDPDSNAGGPQVSASKMSTQQMFECLRDAGCVDLSTQIDSRKGALTKVLGGGFGDIRQGTMNNGTKVAIKAWRTNPLEQSDHTSLMRVARELFDLTKIDHPNMHRLQGVMMFKGQHLGMVSEWMDHSNLYEYLVKHPDADRYQLCTQVASGLDYMHRRGKVHGNLKAVNVAVSSDGIAKLSHLDSSVMSERAAHELFELSRTNHPNVHRMLGVMIFKGLHLGVVSEWVDHSSLYEYIMKYPDADRFQLCTQVASGLDYMHRRGKVHGDLKAVNVVVSSDGIAKLSHLDSSIMSEGSCLVFHSNSTSWPGTFRWTAPEILLEEIQQKTTQTDVYALGMVDNTLCHAQEIFTGQPPYPNCRSDISVIRTVERGTLPTRPITLENNRKNDKMWGLLVHGNLKAVNVGVSSDGIAKLSHLDSSVLSEVTSLIFLSNNHSWPGIIRWAAPEILLEEVTQKTTETDVYALGMTMLEVFAGHAPYPDCRSDISVIRAVDRGTLPARPTQLGNNQKDDKMWQLLVRCWSRSPKDRPSAGFIAGALEYMA
ncbi:unnamed protein product [Rhizoctonia solani]|uniref:Protein kinase domain-containing protein n=1 Tax=Rhizoctonia solani TaxID=456999 RepID=A0A8H3E4F7_9AGAM|nr:unnamed protein product [Rhizoctonia solani]